MRSPMHRSRRISSRGFGVGCSDLSRKIIYENPTACNHHQSLERSVLRDSTPRHARTEGFGSDLRQDAGAADNADRR